MKRALHIVVALLVLCFSTAAAGQSARQQTAGQSPRQQAAFSLGGCVTEAKTGEPLPGVFVRLDENYIWAVTDVDGKYVLEGVQAGTYDLEVGSLGYVTLKQKLSVTKSRQDLDFALQVSSLALDEVVVTASKSEGAAGTTRTLGREALDHLQMTGVSDIAALMPGGKTLNPDLTTDTQLSLRSGGTTAGNAAFGTAVEVDGVRLGGNASATDMAGASTRGLAVENIESVEVVTGVPSAEYGDLNSGLVRVITRKGRTPVKLTFAVNPRTYEASVSKGIDLGEGGGVLNVSGEWARATSKLSSPYTSYTRRSFTFDYSNNFRKVRLEAGITGNIGGMNSESDPDLFSDEYTKARDNVFTPHAKLVWLLNKSWVTNISLDGSIYFHDQLTKVHAYNSYASSQPAVHSELEGYFLADALPLTFYSDEVVDSKELDYSASLKYDWMHHFGSVKSVLKAGIQWKATGNVGKGEYYEDPALAANGYRPRPYTDFPYMHNLSFYAEEKLSVPVGKTELTFIPGLRVEKVMIRGGRYDHTTTLSPRLNLRWKFSERFSVHGGWGITEKLPSFYILYPKEEYRDILTFGVSYGAQGDSRYVYYTQPYIGGYNPDLRWQRNTNTEFGLDATVAGIDISLSVWRNVTRDPYKFGNVYSPISYAMMAVPDGFVAAADPDVRVDHQTGQVWMRGEDGYSVPMNLRSVDRSFAGASVQANGSPIVRSGVELTADFPEIRPVRTKLRLDASYAHSRELDETLYSYYYRTMLASGPYPYVGIYVGSNNVFNGNEIHTLDANLTAITHIPAARLIITCRLEGALLRRSRRLSEYQGNRQAFRLDDGYWAVWPVQYMDLDGKVHPFTDAQKEDPAYALLRLRSSNVYTFEPDGYDPYFSANLSLTKEIGDHVSFSFFANNFTNSRRFVKSYATGVAAIFTPAFYYGLTCRIKL